MILQVVLLDGLKTDVHVGGELLQGGKAQDKTRSSHAVGFVRQQTKTLLVLDTSLAWSRERGGGKEGREGREGRGGRGGREGRGGEGREGRGRMCSCTRRYHERTVLMHFNVQRWTIMYGGISILLYVKAWLAGMACPLLVVV